MRILIVASGFIWIFGHVLYWKELATYRFPSVRCRRHYRYDCRCHAGLFSIRVWKPPMRGPSFPKKLSRTLAQMGKCQTRQPTKDVVQGMCSIFRNERSDPHWCYEYRVCQHLWAIEPATSTTTYPQLSFSTMSSDGADSTGVTGMPQPMFATSDPVGERKVATEWEFEIVNAQSPLDCIVSYRIALHCILCDSIAFF